MARASLAVAAIGHADFEARKPSRISATRGAFHNLGWGGRKPFSIRDFETYRFGRPAEQGLRLRPPKSERDLALAQAATLISICLSGGASHREALKWVANRATGAQLEELALLAEAIDSGVPVEQACELAEHATLHPRFRELVVKIGLSSQLGTRLGDQLGSFANTLCAGWLSDMRSISQRAETRMLIPQVTLTLPLTILFSLYPSLKMLNGSFI